jgi:hypothetical protein
MMVESKVGMLVIVMVVNWVWMMVVELVGLRAWKRVDWMVRLMAEW